MERKQAKERKNLQKEIAEFEAGEKATANIKSRYGALDAILLATIVFLTLLAVALLVLVINRNLQWKNGQIVWQQPSAGLFSAEGEVVEPSPKAGAEYVGETLFLGDSNTVRLGLYGLVDARQVLAKDSVGIEAVTGHPFILQNGKTYTMLEIIEMEQPVRVVMTFGTNNISPNGSTETFIKRYREAVNAIREASPDTQIIVNSIPPVQQVNQYPKLSMKKINEYNKALQKFCIEENLPFLNSAPVLQNEEGYLQKGFAEGDGIHLTQKALEAVLEYFETHRAET